MDLYLKSIIIAIAGILLCLILSKNARDYAVIIGILLCCSLCMIAVKFLKPIFEFMDEMEQLVDNHFSWLEILLKTVGLSMIGETASLICSDAGHAAVGKMLQLLTTVVILWVSLPLIQNLMDLIRSILEKI